MPSPFPAITLLLAVPSFVLPVLAQSANGDARKATGATGRTPPTAAIAIPVTSAPVIDGRADDSVWTAAPALDRLLEYSPRQDVEPRFRTSVQFAFDQRNLYIVARMFDPAPDSIVDRLGRRDMEYPADWIAFTIDGYRDRRTAHEFRVSAGGGIYDALVTRDGISSLDATWDAVWDAAVRTDAQGWVAELRIPFSQLRYTASDAPVFGLVVRREIGREDAQLGWPRIDFNRVTLAWVSQGGDLTGLRGVGSASPLELSPYLVGRNQPRLTSTGFSHPSTGSAGVDLRYRITPNLTLSGTVNPDFGQVESDPAELNLSAYELFFPERRQFFLEGASIFSFLGWCDDVAVTACKSPFYTRRVGRAPQLGARFGDAASPLSSTIDGALKLAGRMNAGLSLGLFGARARRETGTLGRTIEPATTYLVGRARQELAHGQGDLGVILTGVDRQLDEWTTPYLRQRAWVAGLDGQRRFGGGVELQGSLLRSYVAGSPAAILATQLDAVHRYQRPDDELAVDSARTSLSGASARLALQRATGALRYEFSWQYTSPGFEMNDLGYQQRADRQWGRASLVWFTRPVKGWYRSRTLGMYSQLAWTSAGMPLASADAPWPNLFSPYVFIVLQNTAEFRLRGYLISPHRARDDRLTRGGPSVIEEPAYGLWGFARSDTRRAAILEASYGVWSWDASRSGGEYGRVAVLLRPNPTLQASFGLFMRRLRFDQTWHSNRRVTGTDSTAWSFARLNSFEFDPQLRVDWTLTPRATFQLFAQPYAMTADFDDWRDLDQPDAPSYHDRWRPRTGDPGGYDQQQLNSNAVLRWEYRPGSTLFMVWQHRRRGNQPGGATFDLTREARSMFAQRPDNTLLVKVSYWFNPAW